MILRSENDDDDVGLVLSGDEDGCMLLTSLARLAVP